MTLAKLLLVKDEKTEVRARVEPDSSAFNKMIAQRPGSLRGKYLDVDRVLARSLPSVVGGATKMIPVVDKPQN